LLDRCPATAAAVATIPGLESASFALLAPGTHVPEGRGPTRGLIACQLGLVVPRDGDPRMRIGGRVMRWAEGETIVFDDSYPHELWNDSAGNRLVLLVNFRRPLRPWAKGLADVVLAAVGKARS
jgi:beta-hydroxylase